MPRAPKAAPPSPPRAKNPVGPARAPAWKLEDAKARFSEVVRRARAEGPQYVTLRGKPTVAVIDIADLERWMPPSVERLPLVEFLEGLDTQGLDLTRERDNGRDPDL
jgi:prevent-host-death family protein